METLEKNFVIDTDTYKFTHWMMYPKDLLYVYSYMEARKPEDFNVFFGLQEILKENFEGRVVTQEKIEEAEKFVVSQLGNAKYFNRKGWEYILSEHDGKLPLRIKAVPEGTVVNTGNVLVSVENTDENVPWLTNHGETLLMHTWYPTTVATTSYKCRARIHKHALYCGTKVNPFQLHDFGFRGASSCQSAGYGAAAHLVNFYGTDTTAGVRTAKKYYNAKDPVGLSVPAAEHSVITAYGPNNELECYRAIINSVPDDAIVSIVSDTYDIYHAVQEYYCNKLFNQIISRKGKVVIRPDSGDPVEVSNKVVEMLWKKYGGTVNSLKFKTLDPHIGVIYGDYIDYDMIGKILEKGLENGFSTDNFVFGMGGALHQKINRDTYGFAFKCSAIKKRNCNWIGVQKTPVTDKGKFSKKGRLALKISPYGFTTLPEQDCDFVNNALQTVFDNGNIIKEYTFDQVRINAGWNTFYPDFKI